MKTGKHAWRRFDTLTDGEVHDAALKDPDAPPLSDAALARMKPVARPRTLRRALRLTQEEFAARYRIPVGTLRDWEQGRAEPDQSARAYLTVIAHDPEGVRPAQLRRAVIASTVGAIRRRHDVGRKTPGRPPRQACSGREAAIPEAFHPIDAGQRRITPSFRRGHPPYGASASKAYWRCR